MPSGRVAGGDGTERSIPSDLDLNYLGLVKDTTYAGRVPATASADLNCDFEWLAVNVLSTADTAPACDESRREIAPVSGLKSATSIHATSSGLRSFPNVAFE